MVRSYLSQAKGNLIIGGRVFPVNAPVINWNEGPRWNALSLECIPTETDPSPPCLPGGVPHSPPASYGPMPVPYHRYSYRPALANLYSGGRQPNYDQTKAVIRQFVIHHDGCSSADMCFSVLQNERGNSVHFMLDNDGTIFQTCDLAIMAYHASEWNVASIGVEMCNRGDASKDRHFYDSGRYGPKRDIVPCKINGSTILTYKYTAEQMDSLKRLCRELLRLLPNLPAEFPQSSPGVQSWGTMPHPTTERFAGYIGHYHLTEQKWDPGDFDFKQFCSELRGEFCFPLFAKDDPKRTANDRPVVPQKPDDLEELAKEMYKLNEQRADGGFFPVGPWGESRLWHGGVHLVAKEGDPVYAPFPGRIVAARQAAPSPIGSVNFVLLKHDMTLGETRVPFYSLYMHLSDEQSAQLPPPWMTKPEGGWKQHGKRDDVVPLDEPVDAGTVIGHIGKVGPGDLSKPQIHVEFFSVKKLFVDMPRSPWKLVDGSADGRFCESPDILTNIDTNKDAMLSHQELTSFYAGGGAQQLRYVVTFHVSEWTPEPSWSEALRVPKDFKNEKIDELVADQITPGLWWDVATADHCGLPVDGVVYHYHPIAFVSWFNQQQLDAIAADGGKSKEAHERDAKSTDVLKVTDDREGGAMRSIVEVKDDPCNKLTLKDLANGFETPECGS